MKTAIKDSIDLDRLVDYRAEYTAVIEKYQISGDNLTGLCPFHQDRENSFSVDLITGKWHCFSEDEGGNFVSFWAKYHGYGDDTKRAYKEILSKYGVDADARRQQVKQVKAAQRRDELTDYTLKQYAFEKRLPEKWLAEDCHLSTERDRDGHVWLKIPYIGEDGQVATYRKRYGGKQFRWRQGSSGKICLYGAWRLPEICKKGYAVLVEGESDTHSLWYMGIPAIGVAGAAMFKPEQATDLQDLTLYIHQEPDKGGETFVQKTCTGLRRGEFIGEVKLWSCSKLGVKDPSDLYIKYGQQDAARMIREALESAEPIDIAEEPIPEAVAGAPLHLRQPEGWIYSEKGISLIDEKKYAPVLVCRTPMILTKRIKSVETREEKIEVAFKRDGQWTSAIFPRSIVFSNRGILELTGLGCTVTSENAKQVVKFLGALEAENIDIIPKADAISTFGWQSGRRFMPGKADNLVLDIDSTQQGLAAAYCQNGTLERWVENMAPHRQRHKFRFILAASFAAPLLRIVKQRIFFVYNWGGSKGGKTATLKAALSAWGDPERLMTSFNATAVGLERTASFFCDLPLGIDERQLASSNKNDLVQKIYMIASGTGKIRGNKGGGLQTTHQWRTVALATGEEPIGDETTMTGVSTRVLEIYGGPFDNEREASDMYGKVTADHGWAGPEFIRHIIALTDKDICEAYERMRSYVNAVSGGKNGSHVAGVAVVALADAMADSWLFCAGTGPTEEPVPEFLQVLGIRPDSWAAAKEMAANILAQQVENNASDVNENAVQYVVDWVLSNRAYFGSSVIGTCLGFTSDSGDTVYIYPSMLTQALSKAGFSARKTIKYMADRGLISEMTDKTGKKTYSVIRRFGSRSSRFVEFFIGKLTESVDIIEAMEDEYDERPVPEGIPAQLAIGSGFIPIEEDGNEALPF